MQRSSMNKKVNEEIYPETCGFIIIIRKIYEYY